MKIKNRSATEMSRGIHKLYEHFLKNNFNPYTVYRGKELACYTKREADLKVPVYFADSYSSWCRASNENAKGLLRENFLKKAVLALCLINYRPRKGLGWKTSWVPYPRSAIPLW